MFKSKRFVKGFKNFDKAINELKKTHKRTNIDFINTITSSGLSGYFYIAEKDTGLLKE